MPPKALCSKGLKGTKQSPTKLQHVCRVEFALQTPAFRASVARTLNTSFSDKTEREKFKITVNGLTLQKAVAALKLEADARGGRPATTSLQKLAGIYKEFLDLVQPLADDVPQVALNQLQRWFLRVDKFGWS